MYLFGIIICRPILVQVSEYCFTPLSVQSNAFKKVIYSAQCIDASKQPGLFYVAQSKGSICLLIK